MAWLRSTAGRLLVVAVVVALVIVGNVLRGSRAARGVEVETLTLGTGELSVDVKASGVVEPADPAEVRAPMTGRLAEVTVEPGDAVEAGQVLARYDAGDLRVQIERLEHDLVQARASLADLEARRSRAGELARAQLAQAEARYRQAVLERDKLGHLPPWDEARQQAEERVREAEAALEELRARLAGEAVTPEDLRAAQAAVTAAETALRQARAQLADVELRAPAGGTVLEVGAEPGEAVAAGQLLVLIARLGQVDVVAEVDEVDIGKIRPGLSARVSTLAYPDRTFTGTVTRLAPTARREGDVAVFDVRIRVDNPEGLLRPGMTVSVEIETERRSGVLVVPYEVLTVREGKSGVFVVEDGTARFRPVETGLITETHAEITGGVDAGAVIVSGPPSALRVLQDGDQVRLAQAGGRAGDRDEDGDEEGDGS